MAAETVLLAVLAPLLLLVGIAAGAALATYGRPWLARLLGRGSGSTNDPEAATPALEMAVVATRPAAVKTRAAGEDPPLHSIHVVASTPSLLPSGWEPASQRNSFIFTSGAATPLRSGPVTRPGTAGGIGGGIRIDSPLAVRASPFSQPLMHRRTPSREVGHLVRQGASALSQVMDEWDTRSALCRLVSDGLHAPSSPGGANGSGGLFSRTPSLLFSPAPSIAPMPSGEVHMDEIDLIERIGKGGFG